MDTDTQTIARAMAQENKAETPYPFRDFENFPRESNDQSQGGLPKRS